MTCWIIQQVMPLIRTSNQYIHQRGRWLEVSNFSMPTQARLEVVHEARLACGNCAVIDVHHEDYCQCSHTRMRLGVCETGGV